MKLGSMFTGYGGLDMAVNAVLGSETAWHCEIEPAAIKLLEHHYPGVPNLGNVSAIDWTQVEPVDAIAAGFPCQPISYAGKGLMQNDPRWLWPIAARAISVLRPRFVFLENVSALTRRGLVDVLADLAALGFDAEWECVRASDIGAPHERARLFIYAWQNASDSVNERINGGGCSGSGGKNLRTVIGELTQAAEDTYSEFGDERRQPTAGETQAGRPRADLSGRNRVAAFNWSGTGYEGAIARWETLSKRMAPSPVDDKQRLAPIFIEWMMGLTEGHVTNVPGLSRAAQIKMLGNGVVSQQAEHAYRSLIGRSAQ